MSSTLKLKTRNVFLCGYFREIEKLLKQNIPKEIIEIVKLYESISVIFGIGSNYSGQLGLGSMESYKSIPEFTELKQLEQLDVTFNNIYTTYNGLMALTNNGELYVTGNNNYHKLGMNKGKKYDSISEFAKLQFNANAIRLTSNGQQSEFTSFIYTASHELYASGCNLFGQLGFAQGLDDHDQLFELKQISTKFLQDKSEYITQIECASERTILLSNTGLVYVTGANTDGYGKSPAMLSMNNENTPIIKVSAGYDHFLFLDKQQRLITYGENDCGQSSSNESLDVVNNPTLYLYFNEREIKIKEICAGTSVSLCIDIDGGCYLFGDQSDGKLGNGKTSGDAYIPFKISEGYDTQHKLVIDGSLGEDHTILLTNKNEVVTFGRNSYHQCSPIINDETISQPHIVSKTKELGILESNHVEKVLALNNTTLIFVDPNR